MELEQQKPEWNEMELEWSRLRVSIPELEQSRLELEWMTSWLQIAMECR